MSPRIICRGKALNMDHFYKNIRNIFLLQQIGTIFIVSVAYSSVDIALEALKQLELNYQSKSKSNNVAKWSIIWTRACNMNNSGSKYGP